jgi:hypothetical protein
VAQKRRGRPSKSPGNGETKLTGVRLPPDLRRALEKVARENGCTLSAEIEGRLRSTFPATRSR